MKARFQVMAAGLVAACGMAAQAQTPGPLTNGSFEEQNPFNANEPRGWHNASNPSEAVYRKTPMDGLMPMAIMRTGNRSVMLRPVPGSGGSGTVRAWTTDVQNFFSPGFPFYDPFLEYGGGDVHVRGYYAIPATNPISDPLENVGMRLDIKLGNQDFATKDIHENTLINGHTNGEWVFFEAVFTMADIEQRVADSIENGFPPASDPDHCKITLSRFANFPEGVTSNGVIFWEDMTFQQIAAPTCTLDYNLDTVVNPDDLGDFITDYYTSPAIPGPGGYAVPCPENSAPYDQGYKTAFVVGGGGQCNEPFPDNLGDWITQYFGDQTCG
ncbi:MAG: hypothetical protein ACKVS8_07145 [Phycisphaerales bacterium]